MAHSCLISSAFGQQEWGNPFYEHHFSSQEYQGHQTNWAVAQHPNGLIYVANNVNGVLEYDGVRWRQIAMPTPTTVRSLDVSSDGTVYVGTGGDFGYLAADSLGQVYFNSLLENLDADDYGFSDVWGTHATDDGVYFQTRDILFKWDGEEIQSWEPGGDVHTSFEVRGDIFVRTPGKGLMTTMGDSLVLLPGGETFESRSIFSIEPYGEDSLLIATRVGFYIFDGQDVVEFETELDHLFADYNLYHGTAISDSTYAYALIGDGVYILNSEGSILRHLHSSGFLPDNEVNFLFQDASGGLWMALHNSGLYRAHLNAGLSIFDTETGLTGLVSSVRRFDDDLYVSTTSGLYELERSEDNGTRAATFVEHLSPRNVHTFRPFRDDLIVASDQGLHRWNESSEEQIMSGPTFSLSVLQDNELVAVGHESGLRLMYPQAGRSSWGVLQVQGIDREIRSITRIDEGEFWAAAGRRVVYRIRHDGSDVLSVDRFNENDGVPDVSKTVISIRGVPFLVSRQGSLRFAEDQSAFVTDTTLIPDRDEADDVLSTVVGGDDRVYIVYTDRVEVVDFSEEGGAGRTSPEPLKYPREAFAVMFVEESGVIWISDEERLVRYDPDSGIEYGMSPQPLIRGVEDAVTGATIYGGAPTNDVFEADGSMELPYSQNIFRISFAQPEFNVRTPIQYQYRTTGRSKEWSEWSAAASTTVGALPEGSYRFEVRARNERGAISGPVHMAVHILPPWYRTWWAYGAYILIGVFVTMAYRQYRELAEAKRRSEEQAQALARERLVTERLKQANESLDQANKLKETFLANTSHELRTPLTAILGFASVLKEEAEGRHKEFLGIIEENGERLLRTLNALLDLAIIQAGIEEPELKRVDVPIVVKGVIRMMDPLAENKSLPLNYEGPAYGVHALLDEGQFRRIMQNLIGNAIKFTEDGHVTVRVRTTGGEAVIKVIDTGIGISEEFLPELFDEFQQESSGESRNFEGTGLGLAISSRLVQVMDGSIAVESEKGEGSVFTITFELMEEEAAVTSVRAREKLHSHIKGR